MINRKATLASGIAAAVFAMSTAGASVLNDSYSGAVVQPNFPAPAGGSVVLYDQTGSAAGNGAPIQNFEAAFDAYDSEGADDFVVPAAGWTITQFNLVSTVGTPLATTAAVSVYPDAGGVPAAAPTCSYAAAPANVAAGSTTITLPTSCVVGAGTYWVAVEADVNFGSNGQIFWSNSTAQLNSAAVWRNPGDGFGSGCTTFTAMTTCGVGGGTNPDFLFQVVGTVGGGGVPFEPARELPTLSQWSTLFAMGGLALLGMFGLRRRSRR